MKTKDTTLLSETKVEEEIDELSTLRARIVELESKNNRKNEESKETKDEEAKEIKIQQDDYIPVMSLLPYALNLSTKEGGQGNIKKFSKFGEIKRILYNDLVEILEVHPNFLEAGYFYILNPDVVRHHGLDDIYSKILTKDKIEKILSTKSEDSMLFYKSANPQQQETIIEMLIDIVRDDPDKVDLNMIDRISRESKIDIVKKAEDSKPVKEETE